MNPNDFNRPRPMPSPERQQTQEVGNMEGWHAVQSTLLTAIQDARTIQGVRDAADALFHARLLFKGGTR